MDCSLPLTPEEAKTYANILEAVSALPKSDPRYSFVIGVTWWLFNRRRRLEQQNIRRRQFYRRWRRLLLLRWQTQRNLLTGISAAVKTSEMLSNEHLDILPEKRLWVRKDRKEDFWSLLEEGEFGADQFLEHFHMSNATFEFIYHELSEHLTKSNTTMRDPIPGKKRLAATIYRLATNAEYLKVANFFGIGKSTTTSLVRDVCEIIVNNLKSKYLTFFPASECTVEENVEISGKQLGITQCVGVLGSTDVFILGSSWNANENTVYTSAHSKSLQLAIVFQAIVDYTGCVAYVSAGSPASLTNAKITKESPVDQVLSDTFGKHGKDIDGVQVPAFVVADETHGPSLSSSKHLLTPSFSKSGEEIESSKKLNERIHTLADRFENCLLKIKSRWRIFHGKSGKINFNADAFENIAMACCILHNICEIRDDPLDQEWSSELSDDLYVRKTHSDELNSQNGVDSVELDQNASEDSSISEIHRAVSKNML